MAGARCSAWTHWPGTNKVSMKWSANGFLLFSEASLRILLNRFLLCPLLWNSRLQGHPSDTPPLLRCEGCSRVVFAACFPHHAALCAAVSELKQRRAAHRRRENSPSGFVKIQREREGVRAQRPALAPLRQCLMNENRPSVATPQGGPQRVDLGKTLSAKGVSLGAPAPAASLQPAPAERGQISLWHAAASPAACARA